MSELISENIYRLPFNETLDLKSQPAPFHAEVRGLEYALDFAMPLGSNIYTARAGLVLLVIDGFKGPQ